MTQTSSAPPVPRTTSQRREHAQAQLRERHEVWLATGGPAGPHLIPVNYVWGGTELIMATFDPSPTVANLRDRPAARVAIGDHDDVTMIDGTVALVPAGDLEPDLAEAFARVSHDPRAMPGLVYLRFRPRRAQVWNGFHEFTNRTVMRDGVWVR
ncbi:pyridoxamine 5'-phosphate oxidase family protein [Microlunatus sp. GCM10028923]|uniref:pyridoxamine 5'-phosphate oxidase family protein n=1 Tax=Microlunatus sp. GCM10028923 TaxID=3273400 RepID=UPI00361A9776